MNCPVAGGKAFRHYRTDVPCKQGRLSEKGKPFYGKGHVKMKKTRGEQLYD
jgi:hypothetical protein